MLTGFFKALFYQPLYNGLIFLMFIIPVADAGLIVILFTFIVKLILFPLSKKSVVTQMQMKRVQPELDRIKKKYEKDKQEQARQTLALYKKNGINPFSSFFLILIQLPIIFALYHIFLRSGLPIIDQNLLYSFVPVPQEANMMFLGLIDISAKSYILAGLAAISSFFQIRFSIPPPKKRSEQASFQEDLARSMSFQMRYFFPIIVFFIAYNISGVIALYWITSNLFMIGQELYMRKRLGKGKEIVPEETKIVSSPQL